MKIRTFFALEGNIYRVTIHTQDWSEGDLDLMEKFGEPEIDKGGDIDGTVSDVATFVFPNELSRIRSGSPFTERFDADDFPLTSPYPTARDRAELWQDEIVLRIREAVDTLRANSDGFTGEEVVEV